MIFSARTQHKSIHIEWFHVVTGRFLTLFITDTTPPKLRMEILHFVQDDRTRFRMTEGSGKQNEVQDDRGMVQDDRGCRLFDLNEG